MEQRVGRQHLLIAHKLLNCLMLEAADWPEKGVNEEHPMWAITSARARIVGNVVRAILSN